MRINLRTDAPKHNHALMKISTYHKQRGDYVFLNSLGSNFDFTYVSLLYTDSIDKFKYGDVFGGPAFCGRTNTRSVFQLLKSDIELCKPDLELFKVDYSVGYSFRPCFRGCQFCKVRRMQHPDSVHHSIWEFHNSKYSKICILNNNTFQDKQWKTTFEEIWDADLTVVDENGYDLRLIDDEKAEALKRTKFDNKLHFAWDRIQDENEIIKGLQILKKFKIRGTFYILINFDSTHEQNLYRCQVLKDFGFDFYIMPYRRDWYGRAFKRFIDSFMWRKFKTMNEAWDNYLPYKIRKQTEIFYNSYK